MIDSSKLVIGMTSVIILVTELALAVYTKQVDTTSPQTLTAFNTTTSTTAQIQESHLLCLNTAYNCTLYICFDGWPSITLGNCATYNEDTRVLTHGKCPSLQTEGYNLTRSRERILLPRNVSQFNRCMCDPLNRKGLVCSECADGFGPSVTSFQYKCVKCKDAWYRVPLFIFLEFFPITFFYFIILVFQISVTSAPMPCFIMLAQLFVFTLSNYFTPASLVYNDDGSLRLDIKVILTFYGLFNLDFFRYDILPPYCLSTKLQPIHLAYLCYISVLYPMLLIFLTWVCIELHGRNFSPLVWLWRPFHRCFVRLQRGWNTRSDIIDVFTTFFYLSHNKLMFQALLFLNARVITTEDESCNQFRSYFNFVDKSYFLYTIPVTLASLAFIVIPPLTLMLYPFRCFRYFLSKCHLDFIALNIFIDKAYSGYRNGLDGGRDMRSVSSLYFIVNVLTMLVSILSHMVIGHISRYFFVGTLFFVVTLFVAFAKPYQRPYANYTVTLLLSLVTLLCYTKSLEAARMFERILLASPIAVIILIHMTKICDVTMNTLRKICDVTLYVLKFCTCNFRLCFCYNCFKARRASATTAEQSLESSVDILSETTPLIPPNSTLVA